VIERRTTDRWWVPLVLRKGTIAPSIDVPTVTIPIPSIKCLKFKQLNVLVLVVHSHSLFEAKVSIQCDAVVAVIVVRIVFISSFLFYCLLLNHSFPKNPNSVTNCFKLILSIYNFTTTFAQCVRLFWFFYSHSNNCIQCSCKCSGVGVRIVDANQSAVRWRHYGELQYWFIVV